MEISKTTNTTTFNDNRKFLRNRILKLVSDYKDTNKIIPKNELLTIYHLANEIKEIDYIKHLVSKCKKNISEKELILFEQYLNSTPTKENDSSASKNSNLPFIKSDNEFYLLYEKLYSSDISNYKKLLAMYIFKSKFNLYNLTIEQENKILNDIKKLEEDIKKSENPSKAKVVRIGDYIKIELPIGTKVHRKEFNKEYTIIDIINKSINNDVNNSFNHQTFYKTDSIDSISGVWFDETYDEMIRASNCIGILKNNEIEKEKNLTIGSIVYSFAFKGDQTGVILSINKEKNMYSVLDTSGEAYEINGSLIYKIEGNSIQESNENVTENKTAEEQIVTEELAEEQIATEELAEEQIALTNKYVDKDSSEQKEEKQIEEINEKELIISKIKTLKENEKLYNNNLLINSIRIILEMSLFDSAIEYNLYTFFNDEQIFIKIIGLCMLLGLIPIELLATKLTDNTIIEAYKEIIDTIRKKHKTSKNKYKLKKELSKLNLEKTNNDFKENKNVK